MTTEAQSSSEATLPVWRCGRCSRILAKVALGPGSRIEIKCGNCNTYSTKEVLPTEAPVAAM